MKKSDANRICDLIDLNINIISPKNLQDAFDFFSKDLLARKLKLNNGCHENIIYNDFYDLSKPSFQVSDTYTNKIVYDIASLDIDNFIIKLNNDNGFYISEYEQALETKIKESNNKYNELLKISKELNAKYLHVIYANLDNKFFTSEIGYEFLCIVVDRLIKDSTTLPDFSFFVVRNYTSKMSEKYFDLLYKLLLNVPNSYNFRLEPGSDEVSSLINDPYYRIIIRIINTQSNFDYEAFYYKYSNGKLTPIIKAVFVERGLTMNNAWVINNLDLLLDNSMGENEINLSLCAITCSESDINLVSYSVALKRQDVKTYFIKKYKGIYSLSYNTLWYTYLNNLNWLNDDELISIASMENVIYEYNVLSNLLNNPKKNGYSRIEKIINCFSKWDSHDEYSLIVLFKLRESLNFVSNDIIATYIEKVSFIDDEIIKIMPLYLESGGSFSNFKLAVKKYLDFKTYGVDVETILECIKQEGTRDNDSAYDFLEELLKKYKVFQKSRINWYHSIKRKTSQSKYYNEKVGIISVNYEKKTYSLDTKQKKNDGCICMDYDGINVLLDYIKSNFRKI